jgi:multisubunit Na+/H+ antiporter MnhB subunit
METSELLIWIGIGLIFIIVIAASLLFSVNDWSSRFQDWITGKKKDQS